MVTLTTEEHFKTCYDLSKQVFNGSLPRRDAAEELIRICRFDEPEPINATLDLMGILPRLLVGTGLTLIRSQKYFAYCLNRIHEEEPQDLLANSLKSLEKSIEHHFKRGSYKERLRRLHNEFSERTNEILLYESQPPHKKKRGEGEVIEERFKWIPFYENFATQLLGYKDDRASLLKTLYEIASEPDIMKPPEDIFSDGTRGKLKDICPFTVMSMFNKKMLSGKKKKIASAFKKLLAVKEDVPESYEGIPEMPAQNSWFFAYAEKRGKNDIDKLWKLFETAINFADSEGEEFEQNFSNTLEDIIASVRQVGPSNITMGLYWIRPNFFPTLEGNTKNYIKENFGITHQGGAESYLTVREQLLELIESENDIVSFADLADKAYVHSNSKKAELPDEENDIETVKPKLKSEEPSEYDQERFYSQDELEKMAENIIKKRCFVKDEKITKMLKKITEKKNIILQGPPGTGKTWLAKKLGYALINVGQESEQDNKDNLVSVQFHPNMSYEDFVMGWRPIGDNEKNKDDDSGKETQSGKLALEKGTFIKIAEKARGKEDCYVVVIEEINRGNPAQIFGELLTLLEADKRNKDEAINLVYQKEGESFYIPKNLYVIGTMNIADRTLALMDSALRRRFAFFGLESIFDDECDDNDDRFKKWCNEVESKCHAENGSLIETLQTIRERMKELNKTIEGDDRLGKTFCIGHSYVIPAKQTEAWDNEKLYEWFIEVVDSEIAPHLREYWFDDLAQAEKTIEKLKNSADE